MFRLIFLLVALGMILREVNGAPGENATAATASDLHFPQQQQQRSSLTTEALTWLTIGVNHPATAAPPSLNTSTTTSSSSSVTRKNGNNCFFPSEYQGTYQVQSSIDPLGRVQYDQVDIGPQDISVWGSCHALFGQHVLTHTSTEHGDCFRCFHVQMRTASIMQVNTEGLEKCYTKEDVARMKCPVSASIRPGDGIFLWRKSGSIESTPASSSGQNIYRSLCPLDGEFTFTYYLNGSPLCETGNTPLNNGGATGSPDGIITRGNGNNAASHSGEVNDAQSTISNCRSRDILHATFRSCSFTDRETTFKCLGTWEGENGQTFIGLMDFYDDSYAKYRCALYKEEKTTTIVNGVLTTNSTFFVSLSPDSTCSTELYNATSGFETLQLYPVSRFEKEKVKNRIRNMKRKLTMENIVAAGGEEHDMGISKPPRMLFAGGLGRPSKRISAADASEAMHENVTCQFPEWMQGDWQYFSVKTDDMYLKDLPTDFTLFDGFPMANQQQLCVGREIRKAGVDERILLYSQTSCGEEYVSCMWVRKKNNAMMEFRRGLSVPVHDISLLKRDSEQPSVFPPLHICEDSFFQEAPWITQISLDVKEVPITFNDTCPFYGELEAVVGHGEKCAAFSSHCGSPDVFEYKIRSCKGMGHKSYKPKKFSTYDERHYRCVSSWVDRGFTIFMTERLRGDEVDSVNALEQGGSKSRATRNGSSSATVETQCFVMKAFPNNSSYHIASLNSNCRNMEMEDRSWDEYLSQNGLHFRQTANCSTTWPAEVNITSNEIPSHRWRKPGRRTQLGHTNETDENFNAISYAEITSGSVSISGSVVPTVLSFIAVFVISSFAVGSQRQIIF
ncbi:hypothetical protein BV898_01253 [Hypsibius exemplaris]|uniref:Uncharacterized protein n=1 Tax=Hypsibius exemplaris TaxID=2072580 RepID=A0A1W0XC16_HYPEX|nr:hypothetical protein BV898_01253 [Hypsibius exemplaris]